MLPPLYQLLQEAGRYQTAALHCTAPDCSHNLNCRYFKHCV